MDSTSNALGTPSTKRVCGEAEAYCPTESHGGLTKAWFSEHEMNEVRNGKKSHISAIKFSSYLIKHIFAYFFGKDIRFPR